MTGFRLGGFRRFDMIMYVRPCEGGKKNDGGKIILSPSFVFKIMSFRNYRGQDCR